MRGVYWRTLVPSWINIGSSPHARGLPRPSQSCRATIRIIPACAGFTRTSTAFGRQRQDHPRMRGVYFPDEQVGSDRPGSSPHARGLPGDFGHGFSYAGIIPACAGFTSPTSSRRRGSGDHPRMRGVYGNLRSKWSSNGGSSPHARGLLGQGGQGLVEGRIIPACAGFTAAHCVPITLAGDHPRMRGVYCAMPLSRLVAWGSSPHARGLLEGGPPDSGLWRIIPACAGFTHHVPD